MLRTLGTILKWMILLPVLLAIVLFAVANDQSVTVHLNPFDKSDPVLRIELALYQIGFLVFVVGVLFGGAIVWVRQRARSRRMRDLRGDAALWQARAEWTERRPEPRASEASAFLPRPGRG